MRTGLLATEEGKVDPLVCTLEAVVCYSGIGADENLDAHTAVYAYMNM